VSRPLHPLIRSALNDGNAYRVKRAPHGFNVWRFRGWERDPKGFRLVDQVRSRGEAEDAILERLGLKDSTERTPVYVPATITVIEDIGPFDWI
jgi:hypothetical protein